MMSNKTSQIIPSESIHTLTEEVLMIQLTKYAGLSSMILYLYYYVTTLDTEFSVMLTSRHGIGKLLFYTLRYLTLFSTLYTNIAPFFPNQSYEMLAILCSSSSDCVLQLRIWYYTAITVVILRQGAVNMILGPGINEFICANKTPNHSLNGSIIVKLVDEGIMLALALNKGFKNMKQYGGRGIASNLTTLLVKDSVFYFLVLFSNYLVIELFLGLGGYKYVEIPVSISLSIGSIISQHLLVNVRMQASNSLELRLEPMSNIDETQPFSRGGLEFNARTQSSTSLNYRATV
ncbi:hypothetical protein PNOK_0827100 [Pyrrhoderma noxium]|uniref:DUF6533 domain-containing protein n=1 Tax=Pyrrhoderma noxium TaxID=2282107 RepID=A0A286UAP1_9AGAM|nr:hypothetical protein PNOK_0827100 [Pyrrhoderma noxium]